MILLQVQSDPIIGGAISANWVLGGFAVIIGFLLVAFMSNINKNNTEAMNTIKEEIKNLHKRVDTRTQEHDELEDKHIALATKVTIMDVHRHEHAENIANVIINKLYAISPPSKKPFSKEE